RFAGGLLRNTGAAPMDTTFDDEAVDPDRTVAKQLGIHIKSLPRWDRRPELNFPKPLYINGRKYRRRREVQDFLRRAALAHAAAKSKQHGVAGRGETGEPGA